MKSRRNLRARKNRTLRGGCMPEAFATAQWRGGPYAKPRPGELIRKLNASSLNSHFWSTANALANTINSGPLTDIEVCLQKMQAEIAEIKAQLPPPPAEAEENPI